MQIPAAGLRDAAEQRLWAIGRLHASGSGTLARVHGFKNERRVVGIGRDRAIDGRHLPLP
jgi:hypothetical protein